MKFDNGKIATFRPSALRLVSDGTTVDTNYVPPPKKPKVVSRPRSNSLKNEQSKGMSIKVPTEDNGRLLTSIHADLWPGCKVRVLSGRMTGHMATVLSSGNGWVQLESSYGELAKRATELELVSRDSPAGDTLSELPSSSQPCSATVRPILQRRRSNSEPGSPTEISNRRNEFSTRNPMRKERREMVLQREQVQRYIDKQQAKIGARPDLKYWLNRIQGSMVDPTFERNVSRDVRTNYCHSCFMEMWSGSKYCWNELCSASPVYWKLAPGANDKNAPLERYHHAATVSQSSVPLKKEVAVEDSSYACEVLLSLKTDIRMPNTEDISSEKCSVTFAPSTSTAGSMVGNKRKVTDEVKSKRSDSSYTDSEDLNDDSAHLSLNTLAVRLPSKRFSSSLSPIRQSSPRPTSTSPRSSNSPRPTSSSPRSSTSPRPNSSSPRTNFKRMRLMQNVNQGAPPTAEEFARIVLQHEQEQRQQQQQQLRPALDASSASTSTSSSTGPLPGLVTSQHPHQPTSFNNLTTTPPLLTTFLNPDYPTNNTVILPENHNS